MKLSSSELKSFIYGTLLGDAKIERNGKVFSIKQINKDLIDFKYSILKEHFQDVEYKIIPAHFDGKWNHQELYEVRVKDEYFKKLFNVFYDLIDDGKHVVKVIRNISILQQLTPIGLAMWFADDGTTALIGKTSGKVKDRRVEICTENFTWHECEIIKKYFKLFLKYEVSLIRRNSSDRCRVRIKILDAQCFLKDISIYIISYFPSMLYKLDMGYNIDSQSKLLTKDYKLLLEEVKRHSLYISRV